MKQEGKAHIIYQPDNWVVMKICSEGKSFFKLIAGWSGGYLDGNSWRINSGINDIQEDDSFYYIHGNSGSLYKCLKDAQFQRMNISGIVAKMENLGAQIVDINEVCIGDN